MSASIKIRNKGRLATAEVDLWHTRLCFTDEAGERLRKFYLKRVSRGSTLVVGRLTFYIRCVTDKSTLQTLTNELLTEYTVTDPRLERLAHKHESTSGL